LCGLLDPPLQALLIRLRPHSAHLSLDDRLVDSVVTLSLHALSLSLSLAPPLPPQAAAAAAVAAAFAPCMRMQAGVGAIKGSVRREQEIERGRKTFEQRLLVSSMPDLPEPAAKTQNGTPLHPRARPHANFSAPTLRGHADPQSLGTNPEVSNNTDSSGSRPASATPNLDETTQKSRHPGCFLSLDLRVRASVLCVLDFGLVSGLGGCAC